MTASDVNFQLNLHRTIEVIFSKKKETIMINATPLTRSVAEYKHDNTLFY